MSLVTKWLQRSKVSNSDIAFMKQIYTESVLEKLSTISFQNAKDYLEGPLVDFSELRSILTDLASLNEFRKVSEPLIGKHYNNKTLPFNPGKRRHV